MRASRDHSINTGNRLRRAIWSIVWLILYRPTPRNFHFFRRFVLRMFGAEVGENAHPYPSARIWAPWKLVMGKDSCLGDFVDCYNVDLVKLGEGAIVSQYTFLCTASHDYNDPAFPLVTAPITIGAKAWVAADVFVGPGVHVGEGAVVGARSSVFRDVEPWNVVAGSPAEFIKKREPTANE